MRSGVPAVLGFLSDILAGAGADTFVDHHSLPNGDHVCVFVYSSQNEILERGDMGTNQGERCICTIPGGRSSPYG